MSRPRPLDPFGLTGVAVGAVRAGAGVAGWCERQMLGLLSSRLDAIASPVADPKEVRDAAAPAPAAPADGLDRKLRRLLDSALTQGSASSRQQLFHRILDQLVPDEARILGALSDGSTSPLINVYSRGKGGLVGEVVLENASLIGKTANLALSQLTPTYVSHLLALGLVETGPEDPALKTEYEVLAADTSVLKAIKRAARGPIPARIDKATLRLSGLGLELWAAATGTGE